jgi:ATP-dependent helicase/nuclease subunit B
MILSKNKIQKLDVESLLNDFIAQDKLNELLIIVPTNRKIRYLKRELISKSPNKALTKLNLYTLSSFTELIFKKNEINSTRLLSEAAAAVLISKSFKETQLKYFSNYKDEIPRGTLDRIKNVISEYKLNGISPEQIISESKKLEGSEKLKAIDIANVYQNYLLACKDLKAFEVGDIYSDVLSLDKKELESRFNLSFSETNTIVINGFDEFTKPEIEIINNVSNIVNINLYILFDYHKFNPALFSHLDQCYNSFKAKGFEEVEDTSIIRFTAFQQRVREKLFLLNEKDLQKLSEVEIIKLTSRSSEEEIRLIAKEIKLLISEKSVDVDSIVVTFNLISNHSAIIRDIFSEYGIPFNLTDRFSLSESQPIIALINLLEVIDNNFYYKNIFRALTGRWIKIEGVDISNLLRISSNLKIVSGYSNWIETLESTIEQIRFNEQDEDSRFLPIEFYEKAIKDISSIYKLLAPFNQKKNIQDFKNELKNLLYKLDLPSRIINDYPDYIEKNVKAVTVFLETIDEFLDLLELENGRDKKYPLSYFLKQIKTALQFTRFNTKERHASGVLITSVNEIRGLNFDYVFIGSLIDSEFPTRYQPEIFFSGSYKKDEYRHILEERYHFYQTLCCVKKCLYLTFPQKDEKKEFTPSTFINDFNRLFIIKEKTSADYENLIYSKSELLRYVSKLDLEKDKTELDQISFNTELLKRDIEIDKTRLENPFSETSHTGFIFNSLSENAKSKLIEEKQKQYSASQLEEYAKCPFQYFAKRILQLEIIEEPTEELESFELGSLVHSILYEFYKTISEEQIVIADCNDEIFKKLENDIFDIAEKKIEKLRLNSSFIFYEKEKILGIAGNRKNSILYKFLEEERKNSEGYLPEYFEFEFGQFNKSIKAETQEMLVGDVKVRGKIDRIDINKTSNRFKVIDYKLGGKKPIVKDLLNGISLQLPLYLYASKKLIEAELNSNYDPAAAIIYSLKLNNNDFGKKSVHTLNARKKLSEDDLIKSNEELIKICNEVIPAYVNKIVEGKFNLSQLEDRESKVCRFCDFKSICRIQDVT